MARYERIAEELRRAIEAGDYPPGGRIPGENVLAKQFGVSVPTIRHALDTLQTSGVIERRHGIGTFVRERPAVRRVAMDRYRADADAARSGAQETSFTRDQNIDWSEYRLDRTYAQVDATEELAGLLNVEPGAPLLRRHFTFYAAGEPSQVSINYLPWSLVGGTAVADPESEPWPGGTLAQARYLGHPIVRVEESVSARMPTTEEAETLRMLPGTPVQTITRRLLAEDLVVELCRDIVIPADRVILDYAIDL